KVLEYALKVLEYALKVLEYALKVLEYALKVSGSARIKQQAGIVAAGTIIEESRSCELRQGFCLNHLYPI
ncbi:MAG: hypothetical protein LBD79_10115, partial [Treponema sp.]|nr:hypothetical protein [Treponema sp.]